MLKPLESFVALLMLMPLLGACGDDEPGLPGFEEWSESRPVPSDFRLLAEGTSELTPEGSLILTFDVAADISSIEIAAATLPDFAIQVTSIMSPSGEHQVALPDGTFETGEAVLSRGFEETAVADNVTFARWGDASFRYPNDATTTLEPGRWSITVSTFDVDISVGAGDDFRAVRAKTAAPLHVKAFGRVGRLDEGGVDLHILLGPGSGLESDTAFDNMALMGALATIDQIFAQQSVRVRDVIFEDVPDMPRAASLPRGTCDPTQAFRDIGRFVEVRRGYVPIVMIGGFSCFVSVGGSERDVGAAIGGFSPGIPGVYASRGESIVIATALLDSFPDEWLLILAHEVGHFLGLMHVTQPGFNLDDNLADTDTSGANLMYPLVDQITLEELTPQQGIVLRQSPYVHSVN